MCANVLHKTSSGIGSSTLHTATHLINCTALTYTTLNRYWFYAVLANRLFMAYIKQAFIYEILKQYNRGVISFGRFCELINEEAKRDENTKKD